jgi:DNA-directed RNA polymerase subunit M/transcription elongation factor TFIIS
MEEIEDMKMTALPLSPFYTEKKYNSIRRLKLLLLTDCLNKSKVFDELKYERKISIVEMLETGCVNESVRKSNEYNIKCLWSNKNFVCIYHGICYNILSAFDVSESLVEKIINGEIDTEKIAHKSIKELCPEKFEDLNKKLAVRMNMEENVKFTTLYFCRRCKHNKTVTKSVQLRSADEGSSTYIKCIFCGNAWFS